MSENGNSHALANQEKWIKLSRKEVKHIFGFYCVLFLSALFFFLLFIYNLSKAGDGGIEVLCLVLFASACGLLGSTFYYIRKLYKSCIQVLVDTGESGESISSLGAKVYFYFRPVMGAVLAALVILGIYGGFFVLQEQPSINADKFYIFVAIMAFIFGFSNGKLINKLDNSTDKFIEMIGVTGGKNNEH